MKTIAENLQILKDSSDAIKQAIIDNGGTVTGGLSSYADAINNLFLITFTIGNVEYKAKKDMTWGEWINSEYNQLMPNSKPLQILSDGTMGTEGWRKLYTTKPVVTQYPDSEIIKNGSYYISSSEPV